MTDGYTELEHVETERAKQGGHRHPPAVTAYRQETMTGSAPRPTATPSSKAPVTTEF